MVSSLEFLMLPRSTKKQVTKKKKKSQMGAWEPISPARLEFLKDQVIEDWNNDPENSALLSQD